MANARSRQKKLVALSFYHKIHIGMDSINKFKYLIPAPTLKQTSWGIL